MHLLNSLVIIHRVLNSHYKYKKVFLVLAYFLTKKFKLSKYPFPSCMQRVFSLYDLVLVIISCLLYVNWLRADAFDRFACNDICYLKYEIYLS